MSCLLLSDLVLISPILFYSLAMHGPSAAISSLGGLMNSVALVEILLMFTHIQRFSVL